MKGELMVEAEEGDIDAVKEPAKAASAPTGNQRAEDPKVQGGMNAVTWLEFTESTTFHGIRYMFEKKPLGLRRSLWVISVVAAVTVFLYTGITRIKAYRERQVTVNIQLIYNQPLSFPDVTICNQNSHRLTKAVEYRVYDYINDFYSNDTADLSKYGDMQDVDLSNFILNSAHTAEDFIEGCKWKKKNCASYFMRVLTDAGICFTFKPPTRTVAVPGSGHGLRLILNLEQYEYMKGPQSDIGVKVLLHHESETPQIKDQGFVVEPGKRTLVTIKRTNIWTLGAPFDDSSADAIPLPNCQLAAESDALEDRCNCTSIYMASSLAEGQIKDSKICKMKDQFECIFKESDDPSNWTAPCRAPLQSFRFEPRLSSALLSKYNIEHLALGTARRRAATERRFLRARDIAQRALSSIREQDATQMLKVLRVAKQLQEKLALYADAFQNTTALVNFTDVVDVFESPVREEFTDTKSITGQLFHDRQEYLARMPGVPDMDSVRRLVSGFMNYFLREPVLDNLKKCVTMGYLSLDSQFDNSSTGVPSKNLCRNMTLVGKQPRKPSPPVAGDAAAAPGGPRDFKGRKGSERPKPNTKQRPVGQGRHRRDQQPNDGSPPAADPIPAPMTVEQDGLAGHRLSQGALELMRDGRKAQTQRQTSFSGSNVSPVTSDPGVFYSYSSSITPDPAYSSSFVTSDPAYSPSSVPCDPPCSSSSIASDPAYSSYSSSVDSDPVHSSFESSSVSSDPAYSSYSSSMTSRPAYSSYSSSVISDLDYPSSVTSDPAYSPSSLPSDPAPSSLPSDPAYSSSSLPSDPAYSSNSSSVDSDPVRSSSESSSVTSDPDYFSSYSSYVRSDLNYSSSVTSDPAYSSSYSSSVTADPASSSSFVSSDPAYPSSFVASDPAYSSYSSSINSDPAYSSTYSSYVTSWPAYSSSYSSSARSYGDYSSFMTSNPAYSSQYSPTSRCVPVEASLPAADQVTMATISPACVTLYTPTGSFTLAQYVTGSITYYNFKSVPNMESGSGAGSDEGLYDWYIDDDKASTVESVIYPSIYSGRCDRAVYTSCSQRNPGLNTTATLQGLISLRGRYMQNLDEIFEKNADLYKNNALHMQCLVQLDELDEVLPMIKVIVGELHLVAGARTVEGLISALEQASSMKDVNELSAKLEKLKLDYCMWFKKYWMKASKTNAKSKAEVDMNRYLKYVEQNGYVLLSLKGEIASIGASLAKLKESLEGGIQPNLDRLHEYQARRYEKTDLVEKYNLLQVAATLTTMQTTLDEFERKAQGIEGRLASVRHSMVTWYQTLLEKMLVPLLTSKTVGQLPMVIMVTKAGWKVEPGEVPLVPEKLILPMETVAKEARRVISELFTELRTAEADIKDNLIVYHKGNAMGTAFFMENFLQLDIYYTDISFQTITSQEAFTWVSLLSEIGGFMGLLLGASVLTMCEVIDFILRQCINVSRIPDRSSISKK